MAAVQSASLGLGAALLNALDKIRNSFGLFNLYFCCDLLSFFEQLILEQHLWHDFKVWWLVAICFHSFEPALV